MNSALTSTFKGSRIIISKSVSANYAFEDQVEAVNVDATSGPITVTLPLISSYVGRLLTVRKIDSSANAVTIATAGSDLFQGASSTTLTSQWDVLSLDNDGIQWHVSSGGSSGGGGGGGYDTIKEEGTSLTQRSVLNFIGAGITAVDNSGLSRTDVTLHVATGSQEGVVSTSTQTFGGNKTLTGTLSVTASNAAALAIGTNVLVVNTSASGVIIGGTSLTSGNKLTVVGKSDFSDILGMAKIATGSLPTASSFEGYLVYDDTTNELKYSNGTAWVAPSGSSGYATVQEEGTSLTQRTIINFIGPGVTAVDNSGSSRTDVTIHTATGSQEGTVSTTTQSFGGNKTFTANLAATATDTSAFSVGTNKFRVDTVNNRVGVNTTSLTDDFNVTGTALFTTTTLGAAVSLKNTFATGGSVLNFFDDTVTLLGSIGALNSGSTEANPGHAFIYHNNAYDLQIRHGNPGASTVNHAFKADGSFVVGGNTSIASHKLVVVGKSNFSDIIGLPKIVTGSLPTASSFEGYIVYDDTTNELKYSNGTSWVAPSGGGSMSIGGTVTSGTTGSILFVGSGPVLAQDNSNLFWDDTNNRLGISTSSPNVNFHVVGSATDSLQQLAHAAGTGGMYSTVAGTNSAFISIGSSLVSNSWTARATDAGIMAYSASAMRWYTNSGLTNGNTYTPTERMTLAASTGNLTVDTDTLVVDAANNRVGVVTASPSEALHVTGNVRFSGALMPNNSAGTSGQVLQSNGTGAAPTWVANSASIAIGSSITSSTVGSILFVDASNALGQDNTNLFWDDTNNRLGVRVNSPDSPIHVIGTTTASTQHWAGAAGTGGVYLTTDGANSGFISTGSSLTGGSWTARATDAGIYAYSTSAHRWYGNTGLTNGNTYTPTERMTLTAAGNLTVDTDTLVVDATNNRVGVVTASPSEALHVTGNVRFSGALMPNNLPGSSGQVLQSNGAGAAPTWVASGAGMSIGGTVTSGTAGSLLYVASGPVLAQDNSNLFYDSTNKFVGIGNATPNSPVHVTGPTVSTQATGYTSGINVGGTYTKNDATAKTYQVLNVVPTFNFGGSNASTTIDVMKVDCTITSITGATINYLKLAGGGTTRAIFNVDGHLAISSNGAVAPTAVIDAKRSVGTAGIIGLFSSTTGGTTNSIELSATGSPTSEWVTSNGGVTFFGSKSGSSTPLAFRINGSEAARINTSNFFGVTAGVDPFRRLTVQGSEEFLCTFRSTGTKAKHSIDTTGGTFNSFLEIGVDTTISANTGGFGTYIFTGTDSGHGVTGIGDGTTARDYYLKVDGDAVVKIATDRRMKLANAMALGSLSTTNKNALTSVDNGSLVYDSTTNKVQGYENGTWLDLCFLTGDQTASGLKTFSGNTISTAADGTISAISVTSTFTKNDANTRTFPVEQIKPTFNFGGSNTNTTVNIFSVDSTNTSVTGLTANIIRAAYGGTRLLNLASNGLLTIDGATINTDANNAISTASLTASFTKNDNSTRQFYIERIAPTFNFGASNTNTTVDIFSIDSTNTSLTGTTVNLATMKFGGTAAVAITSAGRIDQQGTDSSGSPGAATINKPVGISAIASAATSVTITNSLVTTGSWIVISPMNNTDFRMYKVAAGSGSFTVTVDTTTTAAWAFSWEVKTLI